MVIQLKSAIMLCRVVRCSHDESAGNDPQQSGNNTSPQQHADLPILSIFRYSNRVTRMITEPETSFCPVASNGTKNIEIWRQSRWLRMLPPAEPESSFARHTKAHHPARLLTVGFLQEW